MSLHDGEKDKRATPTTPTTTQTIYLLKAFEGPKMSLPLFFVVPSPLTSLTENSALQQLPSSFIP